MNAAGHTMIRNTNEALALGVLSNLRSLPPPSGTDPRIDLAEASIAARAADYKRQQALAERAASKAQAMGARLLLACQAGPGMGP